MCRKKTDLNMQNKEEFRAFQQCKYMFEKRHFFVVEKTKSKLVLSVYFKF